MSYLIEFNEVKNIILKDTRGVCFDDVIEVIRGKNVLDDLKNKKHPNQRILVIKIKSYIYAVPYVLNKKKKSIFLKTVYPSRVLTKKYLKEAK